MGGNPVVASGGAEWPATSKDAVLDRRGKFRHKRGSEGGEVAQLSRAHGQVHDGNLWGCSHRMDGVIDNAVVNFVVTAGPALVPHMVMRVVASGLCHVEIYPAPTLSAPGTVVPSFEHNQVNKQAPTAVVTHTPTVTGAGTAAGSSIVTAGAPVTVGGGLRDGDEIVLAKDQELMVRVTNKSGATASIAFETVFYETNESEAAV